MVRSTVSQPKLSACFQALLDHVADDHDRRPEELCRMRGSQPNGAPARDVDRRAGTYPSRVRAVEAGREDVRQHRQVEDFLHRLLFVGELEQVPVGVRDHHVLGLATDPAAHVDIAVCRAGAVRVDVEADTGFTLLAVATASTGDVEGHRDEVSLLDELDVAAELDHLAGNLVAEDQA